MSVEESSTGWWAVDWSDRLVAGAVEEVHIGAHRVVVYRGPSGCVHAADGLTPDRGFPLVDADVLDDDSLRTRVDGRVWGPTPSDRPGPRLQHYPVEERCGMVLVGTGPVVPGVADLGDGATGWLPADGGRVWDCDGTPSIALENLCDPSSLGYLLGVPVTDGPQVVSNAPDDLHLRYRLSGVTERTVDVRAISPGLMWVSEFGSGGALFAVTPVDDAHVLIRACIAAPRADDLGPDWAGCVERQAELIGMIHHVPGLNLSDSERRALDAARGSIGASR